MGRLSAADADRIERLFQRHLDVGLHHGAQAAVYVDGTCELNLAGGVTGPEGEETTSETRHVLFSSTKPYAGAALHSLVDDGAIDYDDRVQEHWPSFAEPGSEKATITVRQVLSHTAGIPFGPFDAQRDRWTDWDEVVSAMEAIDPVFTPGEQPSYHALNYGWLVGELVRRVSGTPIDEFVRERIFEPLDMTDTGIGLAEDEPDDVATLTAFEAFDRCRDPNVGMGADHTDLVPPFNTEAIHRATIPAANGIGTAADLARFYACLANGGSLEGERILSEAAVEAMTGLAAETDQDGTLNIPSRYGLGVWLAGPKIDRFGSLAPIGTFGHAGLGSSIGWGNADSGIAFAYVTNGVRELSYEHNARVNALADAVRLAVSE